MEWPAKRSDLNPIDNLWGILSRSVYVNQRQLHSIEELQHYVTQCWEEMQQATLDKLLCSM